MPLWTDYPVQTAPDDADTLLAHDVSETVVGQKMKRTTWASLKAALKTYMDTLYASTNTQAAGIIEMYGGATAPTGYLLCNGASYVRADYAALFAAISTTFGTADGTHFNVPDMRGVYPKGAGTTARATGKDANGNYYAATLGAYATDRMQGHRHQIDPASYNAAGPNSAPRFLPGGADANNNVINVLSPITDGTNGTPRTGLTTEPQNVGLTYIIKT